MSLVVVDCSKQLGRVIMANILKRTSEYTGKVSYRVLIRLKGHPSEAATFDRLTDAKRWAQQTETAIREGRHFTKSIAKRKTLKELIERYERDVLPEKAESTIIGQTLQYRWWKEQIGHCLLADVTPALISDCKDKLKAEGRNAAGVNRYLAALSHTFTIATKEWEWAEDNPVKRVSKLKEPRGRVRFLSDSEREQLLQACKESNNKDLYMVVVLALSTGARKMEIWGLTWNQVDFERKVITIHESKNNERRVLPLTGHAFGLMLDKSSIRRLDTDRIFPGSSNPETPYDFRRPFTIALKKANINDFRWHDLRHSAASYLAMNGATLAEIAEVLGHKTLSMVKRYSHLSEAHTHSVVESMNRKMFKGA